MYNVSWSRLTSREPVFAVMQVRIKVWEKPRNGSASQGRLILEASSATAAVEIGGGPWLETWKSEARMREPLRSLISLPVDVEGVSARLPAGLRPKGL